MSPATPKCPRAGVSPCSSALGSIPHRKGVMGMRFATVLLTGVLSFAAAAGATSLRDNPGYLDFQAMGFFNEDDLSVNVNLDGSLLSLLAAVGATEDRDAAEVLAKLDAVQV